MRWTPGGRSSNLEDRRGTGMGRGGVSLGIGGTLLVALLSLIFGQDFFALIGNGGGGGGEPAPVTEADRSRNAAQEPMVEFVSFVLDDAQKVWQGIFRAEGRTYRDAQLVLFRDGVSSACGVAETAVGPFYCPGDQKVYIDLSFYDELDRRFGAPGDFAQAYVLTHEIGHHVQTLLGVDQQVRRAQRTSRSPNALSVAMELQADCYAGVWGHTTARRNLLDPGDVEEGLRAAAAIGDDRIQRMQRGYVQPDSFTHGSSAQRLEWFQRGFKSGRISECDTFSAR